MKKKVEEKQSAKHKGRCLQQNGQRRESRKRERRSGMEEMRQETKILGDEKKEEV